MPELPQSGSLGACWGDFNGDGFADLYVGGYEVWNKGITWPDLMLLNEGGKGFKLAWSDKRHRARGVTACDVDRDGDLDLVSAGKLFVNQGTGHHWLKVRLAGDGRRVNRSAMGAQVRLKLPDATLTRQVEAGTGQGNQNALTLHFGLGEHAAAVDLAILWPGGDPQRVQGVKVDRLVEVLYAEP